MKIRKQASELTVSDIEAYPVWEFALDEEGEVGQDEATVRPVDTKAWDEKLDSGSIVRVEFTLADGSKFPGCLTFSGKSSGNLRGMHPVVITEMGQVMFWLGGFEPSAELLTESYRKLGRKASEVFPLAVRSDVGQFGVRIQAIIEGFMYLKRLNSEKPEIIK